MASPSLDAFLALADAPRPRAIPVFREILADLDTPVSAFLKLGDAPYAFLLESVEGGERWARYSFIGLDPLVVVRARGQDCEVVRDGFVCRRERREDPSTLVEEVLGEVEAVRVPGMPPFAGGAVGWFGYDAVRWWESLPPAHPAGPSGAHDMCFALPRSLVVFDNLRHRILVAEVVVTRPGVDAAALYAGALRRVDQHIQRLAAPVPARPQPRSTRPETAFDEAAFRAAVERVRGLIQAGDCIQVVLSRRFDFDFQGEPFDLYRALRAVNPSPYMFFLRYPEQLVLGASPEVMLRVQGGEAMVAPIAGTRRRGADEAEDEALAAELLADPKERAEHVMLVDLGRNDLGRVAAPGTVRVEDFMHIERFSHVMHIVSTVRARLAPGQSGLDALRASFPAGTLSGAPKVRAMQIIDELEPSPRGLYGGAVGWLGYDGSLDLCIAIRTATRHAGRWSLQVGAGVVADSDPQAEVQETLNKAGGLLRALEVAGGGA